MWDLARSVRNFRTNLDASVKPIFSKGHRQPRVAEQVSEQHRFVGRTPTLKKTQEQTDLFWSQLPFECYLPGVASVGDWLRI